MPLIPESGKCRDRGPGWNTTGAHGENTGLCMAESACKGIDCYGVTPATFVGWEARFGDHCRSIHEAIPGIRASYQQNDHEELLVNGYLCEPGRGCFDAYGRRYGYRPDGQITAADYDSTVWGWYGWCPPAAIQACPNPGPSPKPSPTPSASPTPPPGDDVFPIMVKDTCPDWYPRRPDHVKVGGTHRAPANPNAWLVNLSPMMHTARACSDENGHDRRFTGGPLAGYCEQWIPCAMQGLHDDHDPKSSWSPVVKAWGPGFNGDDVERRSRPGNTWEPPCPDGDPFCYVNYYLANLVLGDGGSPPGHYKVCSAPTEGQMQTDVECNDFELTLP